MNNKLYIVIFVVVVFVVGSIFYLNNPDPIEYKNPDVEEPVFCTQDAMQCPDGTWVGRTGPNCEFLCPSEASCEGGVCPTR